MAKDYTFSDIDLTFKKHPGSKDVLKKYDVEAVKQAIRNIIFYDKFDKPFTANFGVNINNYLFENFSPIQAILLKRIVTEQLIRHEPRMTIEEVNIISKPDSNAMEIEIRFYVVGSNELQALNMAIERTR